MVFFKYLFVPQLKCVGGAAQYKFTPKVVQCINMGSDGYDIQVVKVWNEGNLFKSSVSCLLIN